MANVAKRFLLSVPGGIFGEANEKRLMGAAVPLSTSRASTMNLPRLPPQLQHAPGFQPIEEEGEGEGRRGSIDDGGGGGALFISSLFSDTTGFLCDFGMAPPNQAEKAQMDVFTE